MEHLSWSHAENGSISTMTSSTALRPPVDSTGRRVEQYITASEVTRVIHESEWTPPDTSAVRLCGRKQTQMRNCYIVKARIFSESRQIWCNVTTKVFTNLKLHITGTHCTEMIGTIAAFIASWLCTALTGMTLAEDRTGRSIIAVWHRVVIPLDGDLNLDIVQEVLTNEGILHMYDPLRYSGLRVKLPMGNGGQVTVSVFRGGKVLGVVPGGQRAVWLQALSNVERVLYSPMVQEALLPPAAVKGRKAQSSACSSASASAT